MAVPVGTLRSASQVLPVLGASNKSEHRDEESPRSRDEALGRLDTAQWQSSGRFESRPPSPVVAEETPRVPPLTPRSQRTLAKFDLAAFAYRHPSEPPPRRTVYQYFVALPCSSMGGYLIGLGGRTAIDIRTRSGAGDFQVLFRQDGLTYFIVTGCKSAIRHALDLVKELMYTRIDLTRWERQALTAAGTTWCDYQELALETYEGYWLLEAFAEPEAHDDERGCRRRQSVATTAETHKPRLEGAPLWPAERVPPARPHPVPDQCPDTSHGRSRVDASRAEASPYKLPHRRRTSRSPSRSRSPVPTRASRRPSAPDLVRPHSSRTRTPPYSSRRVEKAPRELGEADQPTPRKVDSERDTHRKGSLSSLDTRTVDRVEEKLTSLSMPIPVTTIPLFLGPNASGHFIAQTTGVRLVVDASLDGATLRLEPGPDATHGSLLEARQLAEKVLEKAEGVRSSSSPQTVRGKAPEAE
ncbi:hypothetical protein DMC30DRAFT_452525, partial [Rhodotorula diobovata]